MKSLLVAAAALTLVLAQHRSPARADARAFFADRGLAAMRVSAPSDRGIAADVANARGLRDLGPLREDRPVDVGLLMRVRNLAELQQLTLMQTDRRSPYFHHFLTTAQWNAYFAPDSATYAQTLATLARRGFHITKTFGNRAYIEARAPAGVAERYFSTRLHAVAQAGYGVRYRNVTPALMPAELRNVAISVAGLHSIVTVRQPIHFADRQTVLRSPQYARAIALARMERKPLNVPTPLGTSTPSATQPGPDRTLSPGSPSNDYTTSIGGYDPTIYAAAYDYPVYHGYGGVGRSVGTVIEADYLATDAAAQYKNFSIPRTGIAEPVQCADPNATANCDNTIGQADPVGESTLDALVIQSMAPGANFYETIAPAFDDIQLEAAYEILVGENKVDAVNSSFGACETDDPAFGYATNYIAMEGAALGITFEASTGDTGATTCGTYATNGAPQTEYNTSVPSSGYYFTAIGGTMFAVIDSCTGVGNGTSTSPCYNDQVPEMAWVTGGGGSSVIEPIPSWQVPLVMGQPATSVGSTTMRNTPDMAFMAAFTPPDAGVDIYFNGSQAAIGGTSVGCPMFTALQVEINEVQGSRNGWVNPGLYAAFAATNKYTLTGSTQNYAFRDVTSGNNDKYTAIGGYDSATGLGTPLGWELAGVENGTPVATPSPAPTPTPTSH